MSLCTENAVQKDFAPRNMTTGETLWDSKFFYARYRSPYFMTPHKL